MIKDVFHRLLSRKLNINFTKNYVFRFTRRGESLGESDVRISKPNVPSPRARTPSSFLAVAAKSAPDKTTVSIGIYVLNLLPISPHSILFIYG